MAVKIFCSACKQYIKDAQTKSEINSLTGNEVCEGCVGIAVSSFDAIDKAARRGIVAIETLRDEIKAELDAIRKRVIKSDS